MPSTSPGLRVFLCHSSGDKERTRDIYARLKADGFNPWLDEEDLLPGQDWHYEIMRAVRECDVVLVCLSKEAINKKGVVQKEIRYALDVADEQPEGTIYVIPVRLEQCDVPPGLRSLQWVDLFGAQGYERLTRALQHRASSATNLARWTPEYCFTDRFFLVTLQSAFPGALMPASAGSIKYLEQPVTPILPITTGLLSDLTPDEVVRNFVMSQTPDGFIVKLRIPRQVGGRNGCTVERTFSIEQDEVILLESVPVLAIWPNFKVGDSSWKAYFVCYSKAGDHEVFYAEPYAANARIDARYSRDRRGEIDSYVMRMDVSPEAFVCTSQVWNPQTHVLESQPAGVLFIKPAPYVSRRIKRYAVGIDFAEERTAVWTRNLDATGERAAIVFRNRLIQVTSASERRRCITSEVFLNAWNARSPFINRLRTEYGRDNNKPLRPVLDAVICDLLDRAAYFEDLSEVRDIMWSDKFFDRLQTDCFLQQICLQATAELVAEGAKEISWAYSTPNIFKSSSEAEAHRVLWDHVIHECEQLTGVSQAPNSSISKRRQIASALFAREELKAPLASGALCLEIGSTKIDVGLWREDKLIWRTAFDFAMYGVFADFARQSSALLRLFGLDSVPGHDSANRYYFYREFRRYLLSKEHSLLPLLPKLACDPAVDKLIQLIALAVSGLLYYAGMIVRHLFGARKWEADALEVYILGSGSRILHWLSYGAYSSKSAINNLFKTVLAEGTGLGEYAANTKIVISPYPDEEAAIGLVLPRPLFGKDIGDLGLDMLAGESFFQGTAECGWEGILTSDLLHHGIEARSLDQMSTFLRAFNTYAASRGSVIDPLREMQAKVEGEIKKRLSTCLRNYTYEENDEIVVEPIFILALKHLLEIEIEQQ